MEDNDLVKDLGSNLAEDLGNDLADDMGTTWRAAWSYGVDIWVTRVDLAYLPSYPIQPRSPKPAKSRQVTPIPVSSS
jgi:hypothetical protein